ELPLKLELDKLQRREPDVAELSALYRELGFSSLLRELGTSASGDGASPNPQAASFKAAPMVRETNYAQLADAKALRAYLEQLRAEQPLAVWLALDAAGREAEGFGTRVVGIELSAAVGEGRALWVDPAGEALRALAAMLSDELRPKIVHDPKLFQLLTGRG